MESAPERPKPALHQSQTAFGMIRNIAGAMATSLVLINSLIGLFGNLRGGSFTEVQVQIVLLTDAVTNACTWAVAFHTALALKGGVDPADVQPVREGRLPKDSKLAGLWAMVRKMIETRGRLENAEVDRSLRKATISLGFAGARLVRSVSNTPKAWIQDFSSHKPRAFSRPGIPAAFIMNEIKRHTPPARCRILAFMVTFREQRRIAACRIELLISTATHTGSQTLERVG
jgi:AhpD family alkylhydroperoxidase